MTVKPPLDERTRNPLAVCPPFKNLAYDEKDISTAAAWMLSQMIEINLSDSGHLKMNVDSQL